MAANVRFTYELSGAVKEIFVIEKESQNISEGLVMFWQEKGECMIKNIIFDIGNVLASFRPKEVLEEMGLDEKEVNAILDATVRGPYWVELDRGVMGEAEVIEAMRSHVPQCYLADFERFFAEETGKLVRSLPYAEDWLKGLKERGYHVYLLSNYPVGLFEIHSPHFTFLPYTDGRVVSGYVKCVKPDERIYSCLLEKYSLSPQECVFLDDLAENVEGAKKLGIHGIHFQGYEDASAKLERMLAETE